MATIKYFIKGTSNPTTIYLRFIHGRNYDFKKSTSLLINPKYWNNNKGSVRQINEFEDKLNLDNDLNNLKTKILNQFNSDYAKGVYINSDWLTSTIKKYFNQHSETDFNYLLDYAEYFLKNLPNKVLKSGKTGVSSSTIKRYKTIIQKIQDYEKYNKKRLKIIDVNFNFYKNFIYCLHNVQLLNYNTTGRYLKAIKTICLDAKTIGIKINNDVLNGSFPIPKEDVYITYLNEDEIQSIYNYDFKGSDYLDNARNWLIIGVWTGARVSDLLDFTDANLKNGFIEFTTKKTNQKIILPLHPQVETILKKLNGQFPRKITSQKLNDYIKVVCKEVGLKNVILGSKNVKVKEKTWRKVKDNYAKWKLVSTHICRRSFATNHYGKLPTPVIMAITGHTTEKMFLSYIGKTSKDNAEVLNEFWKLQDQKREKEPQLKIVKTGTNNN